VCPVQDQNGYWMTMTVIDLFAKDVFIDLPSFDWIKDRLL
jgi:hypothetical protein